MFRNSPNIISNCVYRSSISIKWLQEILQQLDGDYGECTMKNSLADWVGYRAGMQCFPVYLLYRIHEKFNDAFNFLLTSLSRMRTNHRTGYSSDDLRGVDGQENACPPVAYTSDLIFFASPPMFFSSLKK